MSAIATNTRSTSGIPAGTAPACVAHASFLKPDQMKPVQASASQRAGALSALPPKIPHLQCLLEKAFLFYPGQPQWVHLYMLWDSDRRAAFRETTRQLQKRSLKFELDPSHSFAVSQILRLKSLNDKNKVGFVHLLVPFVAEKDFLGLLWDDEECVSHPRTEMIPSEKEQSKSRLSSRMVTRSGNGSRISISGTPDPQMEIRDCWGWGGGEGSRCWGDSQQCVQHTQFPTVNDRK
ncbi:uncharacterized protein LOC129635355 isoform X5 [Bubalus kerabau]|uniref:uncharacterized protein LOC129635355 isoform X5 n=1 Tax=Bubalus carabanensis TaxID=3119969 RepID=UPI00244EEC48|nr:uncharacterized protein LOC129635355 isoform X5 [Bubalus carabanensis]